MSAPGALVRLLHLASPALPVGAYTYSQGLEWVAECGRVRCADDARDWIGSLLEGPIAQYELPLLQACLDACGSADTPQLACLNQEYLASRESAELRAETVQMGYSMRVLLRDLRVLPECLQIELDGWEAVAYPCAWAMVAHGAGASGDETLSAYAWSWLENQVMAAIKIVPLGQTAGQRILLGLGERIPDVVARARALAPEDWNSFAPGLAIASSRHETQYSRLFRS